MSADMTRRQLVKSAGIAVALGGIDDAGAQDSARAIASVKALVFDTFGTVVDWRGSIVEEGRAWEKTRGITVDWARFGKGAARRNVLDQPRPPASRAAGRLAHGISHRRPLGRRKGPLESRLAPPETVA